VQDLLKDQADRVRVLIEQGAIVYVCGDGGRMEPDRETCTGSDIHGEAGVAKLAVDNRYVPTCGQAAELASNRDASAPATCAASSWRRRRLPVFTAALFLVARHYEPTHWAWGTSRRRRGRRPVGGLADWYAVVALFRRPLGLPIPHTAIIPRNPCASRHLGESSRRISSRPKPGREATG